MNEEERHNSQIKCAETRFINGTTKTSKNQIHLCNLLNGVLNKNIDKYNADILLDNNVIIEYDGVGHFFYDDYFKRDSSTCEEKRTNIILNKGYKIIRIICKNDILPEDNVVLKLIEYAKQFDFSIIDCENKIIYYDNKQIQFKEIL
jgi:very-short-patch-repair endonuclease